MPRHFLKVGCDVGCYAENDEWEEVVEKDSVWGFGEDAGGDYRGDFSIYRTHRDFFIETRYRA